MTTIGPRRVLIVEHEPLTAATLATELGSLGYHVCGVATTPDDALAAVVREQPHVVLMDVHLPDGGDGIDTARHICLGRDTAIVFLTAQSDEATLARALEVSPFGFLVKPFRARELKVAIEVAVTKQAKDAAAAREWQELATTDPLTRLPNRRKLAEVLRTEWDRCRQDGVSIAALMIDVDHFKAYNDTYGHPAGDACWPSQRRSAARAVALETSSAGGGVRSSWPSCRPPTSRPRPTLQNECLPRCGGGNSSTKAPPQTPSSPSRSAGPRSCPQSQRALTT